MARIGGGDALLKKGLDELNKAKNPVHLVLSGVQRVKYVFKMQISLFKMQISSF